MNKRCLYLLLCVGAQWTFGVTFSLTEFGPLYWNKSTAAVEGSNRNQLESGKVQHDTKLKDNEDSQIPMSFLERNDASENISSIRNDQFFSIFGRKDNTYLANNISVSNSLEKPFQIILNDELCNKIERVKNGINELIISLPMDNDMQRFKRSVVSTSSTTIASTVKVHSNFSNRFAQLENNMNTMNDIIKELRKSVSLTDEDKERLSTLEERAVNLENLVDNQSRAVDDERDKLKSTIDTLSNTISSLNADLSALRKKVEEQERSQAQKRLTAECIEDIQSHNFAAAQEKLKMFEDDNKINLIVHQVYNYQAANFYLVIEFGNNIKDISKKFLVYKALNYEMESNGHRDPSKMIRLMESLKREIVEKRNKKFDLIGILEFFKAQSLIDNMRNSLKTVGKDKLKEGMLYNRYYSVVDLAKTIYDYSEEIFRDIIRDVVNEVHGKISIQRLLDAIPNESRYVEQAVATYFALLDTMKVNNEFNSQEIFKVAFRIKNSVGSYNSNFQSLKNRLPESVRNTVFASKVCIKNVLRNEYIYSARVWGKSYDNDRGYVFTWIPGNQVAEGDWLMEPDGENFYIKNYMRNEYIYSARPWGSKFDKDRGYVYTWIPGNREPDASWKIEPNGNNCYIKNVMRSEYLYSARMWGQTYDRDRGYVYTWIPGNRVSSAEWKIEDCS